MNAHPTLTPSLAARFADLALANVVREYPNKLDHVLRSDADAAPPRALHPAFYGSYDWHSCVHMHWLLVRLRRLHPALPQRAEIDALLLRHIAPANDRGRVRLPRAGPTRSRSSGRTAGRGC